MSPADPKNPPNITDLKAEASAAQPEARKPYTASTYSIHAWGASGISAYWMWKEFALIQALFTMGYGMDTRLIGWVYAIPRFFDAAIDPFIGHLSDNFKSPWGRRRPFMFFSCIGGALLVPAMYLMSPEWGDWTQFFYMLPVVLVFYAIWGTYETTRTALGYELSDDYSQRSRIQAIGSAWFTLPSLLGSMTFAVVVQLSTGGTWYIGIPDFRVPWLGGLFLWGAGAVLLAAVIGFLALNQRSRSTQWKAAFATVILAMVLVPAASAAMHGVEGTGAMFHSFDPHEPFTVVSLPNGSQPRVYLGSRGLAGATAIPLAVDLREANIVVALPDGSHPRVYLKNRGAADSNKVVIGASGLDEPNVAVQGYRVYLVRPGTEAILTRQVSALSASAPASQSTSATSPASRAATASATSAESPASQTAPAVAMAGQARPAATATNRPTSAAASQPATQMASTQPATAGLTAWGLDYPGFQFFAIHFPNLGGTSKYPIVPAARAASLVCCGLVLLFGLIPTFLVRERFTSSNRKHVSVWKALLATSKNRPFLVIIVLRIAETLGTSLWGGLSMYVGIYYVCRGDKVQYSMISTFGMALMGFLFAMLVWPMAAPLTKKIGKRWGIVACYGLGLVSALITPFVYHPGWIWVIFVISIGFIFVGQVKGMFLNALMPDICDIDELISGERREGLYSAVLQFINKIESSLVGLLAMYVLAWTGFDSKLASQNVMPGDDVLIRMLWYGFIPMLIFAVVAFVITFFLPLTPAVMAKVHAQLEERRAKAHLVPPELA